MNKKVIKYLIWTIIISALLILMPAKETKAITVYFKDFKKSKNLFCLNKGDRFSRSEEVKEVVNFSTSKFGEITGQEVVDEDVLKYIISEANRADSIYGNRTAIGNYVPQIAIWKLAGSSVTSTEGDTLVANAYAYNNFPSNAPVPKIVKEDNDSFAIYYTETTDTSTGVNGTYRNLIIDSISINPSEAASYSKTETCNTDGYTHKRIYTRNSGANRATVSFDYETSRTADLKIYVVEKSTKKFIYYNNHSDSLYIELYKIAFHRIIHEAKGEDDYYHTECSNYNDLCEKITFDSILDYITPDGLQGIISDKSKLEDYKNEYTFYSCKQKGHPVLAVRNDGNYDALYLKGHTDQYLSNSYVVASVSVNPRGASTEEYSPQNLLYGTGDVETGSKNELISFIQPVTLNFIKKDFSGNNVSGAILNITKGTNVNTISADSVTIGSGSITVMPNSNSGTFTLNLSEEAPTGYNAIPDTTLTVSYNNGTVTGISSSNTTYVPNSSNITVTVKNKPKYNLTINKIDSLTKLGLVDARFKIELTNIESMEKYEIAATKDGETQNSPTIVYVKTDKDGQIKLTGIVPRDPTKAVTATITEVEVPTANGYYYKLLKNPITVTLNNTAGTTTTVDIENDPYINLNGMVWQDGQIGEKNISGPNGIKDSGESALKDVLVGLYSIKDNKYYTYATTDQNGNYSFIDVPKTNEGYKIVFSYDGINWQETKSIRKAADGDSDASEDANNRTNFNNRFKTISKGQSNDGTELNYTQGNGISTLKVDMKGTESETENFKYQMSAESGIIYTTQSNIDCGLVKKELDLALDTYVDSAKLTVNGAETDYTEFRRKNTVNNQPSSEELEGNLYLYRSDYNYRKDDYITDTKVNNVNSDNVEDKLIAAGDELKAYVTYKIALINQTPSKEASVDKFVYYYDSRYTLLLDKSNLNGYKINSNTNNVIEFEKIDKNTYMTDRIELTLTFEVDLSKVNDEENYFGNAGEITQYSTKDGGLIDKDSAPGNAGITRNGEGKAIVNNNEDDSVQAERGLNIQIKEDKARKISGTVFEDTKTGENKEYNGRIDDGEQGIKGVIVQLIEIKKINGQYYEYIWQEKTTDDNGYYEFTGFIPSGGKANSNGVINHNYIVRFIYGDGAAYNLTPNTTEYNGQDYKSTVDANYNQLWYNTSEYEEGASVARDNEARRLEVMAHSTTIDGKIGTALIIFTKNIKYEDLTNGQKYDIVEYYNSVVKPQYESVKNAVEETNPEEFLVANRIRNIFGDTLPDITTENINEDLYNKVKRYVSFRTWMCAETSRINIQVDADDKTDIDSTNVASSNQNLEFNSINFGLVLRPETNIVLEKHITALKITPSGTGVQPIIDAEADIETILSDNKIEPVGIKNGLATIISTRDNRGFWQVATDVEELLQGAQLEVEYTYVLRNDSQKDYLSAFLVNEYEKGINDGTYKTLLTTKAAEVKGATKGSTHLYGSYLGKYYYTGTPAADDAIVPSRIEIFEEALNNDLAFDEEVEEYFNKVNDTIVDRTIYNTAGETKTEKIDTVIRNNQVSTFLLPGSKDYDRTVTLRTTLSSVSGGELGANIPSYIAEIIQYSNAAGRKDMKATPANLGYVHSNDTSITMMTNNEQDEFWGETIIITKPTGEDKLTPIQIVLITISAVAVLGVGIVLIKKFVLKK